MRKTLYLLLFLPLLSLAAPQTSVMTLIVFRGAQAVTGASVQLDGKVYLTDGNGSVKLSLPSGEHRLAIELDGQAPVVLNFTTVEGENLQVLATVTDAGLARFDVESSAGDKTMQTATSAVDESLLPGKLSGQVISSEEGKPVVGARIFVSGTAATAVTDEQGRYALLLAPGTYSLSIIHGEFSTQTLNDIVITSDAMVERTVALTPAGLELAEYVVIAPYIEGSLASVVALQRETSEVAEVLGAEQMAKAGDSDAAGALKRATGLTIEDGKFVVIRGQPSRYTKTLWNGGELPSPDPNRRIVPLDLFPTGILSSVNVQKTYSPDKPGDFAGGLVELNTKRIPDEGFAEVSFGVGLDTASTGQTGRIYDGGSSDWLGSDDGTRALPQAVDLLTGGGAQNLQSDIGYLPDDPRLEPLAESFANNWQLRKETLGPNLGLSVAGGKRFSTRKGDYGLLVSTTYSRDNALVEGPENQYQQASSGDLRLGDQYDVARTETDYTVGGMLTLGAEWGDNHAITSNTFFSRKTLDRTKYTEGLSAENDQYRKEYVLEWVERELQAQQLTGQHIVDSMGGVGITWRAMAAESTRDSPDRRFYRYIKAGDQWVFVESSPTREFQYLTDETDSYGLDFDIPVVRRERIKAAFKVGAAGLDKSRRSKTLTYKLRWQPGEDPPAELLLDANPEEILSSQHIGPDGWYLSDLTDESQSYRGAQTVDGAYGLADVTVGEALRLVAGARRETAEMTVESIDQGTRLETDDTLPAFSLTWFMNESMQLRLGMSETVARPELNELSQTYYYDADSGDVYLGNPDLHPARITSYDARWEWYPSTTETVTAGLFFKDFDDPIEVVWVPFATGDRRSFENAQAAEVFGAEVGLRTGLGRFNPRWERFSFSGNASLIESSVNVEGSDHGRPLQGQAPFVLNIQLGYEGERHEANVLFNFVGERLDQVGEAFGSIKKPDVYLQPLTQLDFNWRYRWSDRLGLKLSARNLTNPTVEYLQGGEVYRSYKKGVEFGFSANYAF